MNSTDDTKKLTDYAIDFAENMLKNSPDFYIFSVTINMNGERRPVGYCDGEEQLSNHDLMKKLQAHHDQQLLNKEIRAYALTYLEKVKKDNTSEITDAIAVKIKHEETTDITICYFAYKLSLQKKIEHLGNWMEIEKLIFTPPS